MKICEYCQHFETLSNSVHWHEIKESFFDFGTDFFVLLFNWLVVFLVCRRECSYMSSLLRRVSRTVYIPMKNSNDRKIASARGTIGRGKLKGRILSFPSHLPPRVSLFHLPNLASSFVLRSVHTRRQVAATRLADRSLHVYRSHKFCVIWFFATCCCDKILLQRQRFSQKFSSTHEAICGCDVPSQHVASTCRLVCTDP